MGLGSGAGNGAAMRMSSWFAGGRKGGDGGGKEEGSRCCLGDGGFDHFGGLVSEE